VLYDNITNKIHNSTSMVSVFTLQHNQQMRWLAEATVSGNSFQPLELHYHWLAQALSAVGQTSSVCYGCNGASARLQQPSLTCRDHGR